MRTHTVTCRFVSVVQSRWAITGVTDLLQNSTKRKHYKHKNTAVRRAQVSYEYATHHTHRGMMKYGLVGVYWLVNNDQMWLSWERCRWQQWMNACACVCMYVWGADVNITKWHIQGYIGLVQSTDWDNLTTYNLTGWFRSKSMENIFYVNDPDSNA